MKRFGRRVWRTRRIRFGSISRDEQFRLYKLIWQRFVSSQMTPAVFDQTTVDIVAQAKQAYDFRVTGSVLKFDGHLKFDEEDKRARQAAKDKAAKEEAKASDQTRPGRAGRWRGRGRDAGCRS